MLAVEEDGVNAESLSTLVIGLRMDVAGREEPIRLIFDHPFRVFVRDSTMHLNIFQAVVFDATES
jgi:serine protease inhibitor